MKPDKGRIVVGYDRSEHSRPALRWAAREAARRHAVCELLYVVDNGGSAARVPCGMASKWWWDFEVGQAEELLRMGEEVARRADPAAEVRSRAVLGVPTTELIEASHQADLVVLGTRSRGELAGLCFGSVVHKVAAHALCPVTVVHHSHGLPDPRRPVVVGVDGSPGSMLAVDFAAERAAADGASLTIVTAWDMSSIEPWLTPYAEAGYPAPDDVIDWSQRPAQEVCDTAVALVHATYPQLDVRAKVIRGPAAHVLTGAALEASLLVVGTRRHGELTSLMLGSVSHAVIRFSPCPIVVVPPGPATEVPDDGAPQRAVLGEQSLSTT